MTRTTALRALFAGAGVAAAGVMGMAAASADDGTQQADLGGAAQLVDGGTVQQWTVGELRPSSDNIGYAPAGTLWEATATNTNVAGGNIPFVPGFSARSGDASYPVLWNVASPAGVNPGGLAPGQAVTGKIYFDVTGGTPNQVAFGNGNRDMAQWVTPAPPAYDVGTAPAQAPSYVPPVATYVPPVNVPVTQPAPAAVVPQVVAPKAPVTGSSGTPIAAATPAAPAPAAATPAPAAATPAPAAATPAPAATTPAPVPVTTPAAEAPASTAPPAPAGGSAGTPLTVVPTTTVPAPAG
jgi:hypothetical protein